MSAPVLIVEDNEDEVVLLRRALRLANITVPVAIVTDGAAAIEYLEGRGRYGDRTQHPLPQLVLLDLRLPRVPGLDVLRWVRQQPGLRRLPVIVFTSSAEHRDVITAYELGANSYLVKPSELQDLQDVARRIHEYWIECNLRPPLNA